MTVPDHTHPASEMNETEALAYLAAITQRLERLGDRLEAYAHSAESPNDEGSR